LSKLRKFYFVAKKFALITNATNILISIYFYTKMILNDLSYNSFLFTTLKDAKFIQKLKNKGINNTQITVI